MQPTPAGGLQETPTELALTQNYPNPFNPTTTIRYALPEAAVVRLVVFNALGERLVELVDGPREAGYHDVRFDGSKFASGVYFNRLHARPLEASAGGDSRGGGGDFVQTRRFVLVK